jgi:3',5'-cyclic AMP phosphodiesterase CpdA
MIASGELRVIDLPLFEALGLGVEPHAGEPWLENADMAPTFAEGTTRQSLLYLWHSADPQVCDEESPIRFEGMYLLTFGSTFRPQSHVSVHAWEASVRTARRISDLSGRPFDVAIVAGDLTDGAQENELEWTLTALGGGTIDPDSGVNDDPVRGDGNDYTDPFIAVGLGAVPWYATIGNHEVLYTGAFEATDEVRAAAVGDMVYPWAEKLTGNYVEGAANGFRDARTIWGEIVDQGQTPADPRRALLDHPRFLEMVAAAPGEPATHGVDEMNIDAGVAYYAFHPLPGKPIRMIALDSVQLEPASSQAYMSREQLAWLVAELDEAEAAGELVILFSHHTLAELTQNSPVQPAEAMQTVAAYDNVVLHLAGHSHDNGIVRRRSGDSRGYWEVTAASSVDFPSQSRIVELVYEDTGYLSVYVTNLDHNGREDGLAHMARWLSAAREFFSGTSGANVDYDQDWLADVEDRNVLFRIALPAAVVSAIEAEEWPSRIESVETLSAF